jgi:hypothetical protein
LVEDDAQFLLIEERSNVNCRSQELRIVDHVITFKVHFLDEFAQVNVNNLLGSENLLQIIEADEAGP